MAGVESCEFEFGREADMQETEMIERETQREREIDGEAEIERHRETEREIERERVRKLKERQRGKDCQQLLQHLYDF